MKNIKSSNDINSQIKTDDTYNYFCNYNRNKNGAISKKESIKPANKESIALIEECQQAWLSLRNMRQERTRNIRYKNGDQWSDLVNDPDRNGYMIKESELLEREGKNPLKHNYIQQYMRNISGQLNSSPTQSVVYARTKNDTELSEMLTNTLQACHQLNQINRIDLTILEELMLSGVACCKIKYDYWDSKHKGDGKVESVSNKRVFFNTDQEDNRMINTYLVGEIHDMTMSQMIKQFVLNAEDERLLRAIYASSQNESPYSYLSSQTELSSFSTAEDTSKCRVIEVWKREIKPVTYIHDYMTGEVRRVDNVKKSDIEQINKDRLSVAEHINIDNKEIPLVHVDQHYENVWNVYYLSPSGDILFHRETPYWHKEHPYVIITQPSVDGTFRGSISDLIDIQRYINRLIVMIDFIMGASAKGVLMVPENCIPDGYSVDDFTSQYIKANGVVVYKPTTTREVPYQISSNSTNVGAWEMLSMQINLMQEISGISGAIQGLRPNNGNTPSSLYAQQAQNSQLNLKVLFDTIRHYQQKRDEKLLKVLMQYYKSERYIEVAGVNFGKTAIIYRPDIVNDIIDFNLVISQSMNTPIYRQLNDDLLKNMLDRGQIDVEMFLSNSSLPFADKLLAQIRATKKNEE